MKRQSYGRRSSTQIRNWRRDNNSFELSLPKCERQEKSKISARSLKVSLVEVRRRRHVLHSCCAMNIRYRNSNSRTRSRLLIFLRYTFNATCFGYVQDGNHRIALLYLTEEVVGMIDQAELARSFKSVDQAYLRIDFANMLATAVSLTKQKHHKTFENLRRLEHNADETAAKKGAKGQSRPPTQIEADAAAKACQGH